MRRINFLFLLVFLAGLALSSCKDPNQIQDNFDRESMVINFADNIILPNYSRLQSSLADFEASIDLLNANPSQILLDSTRAKWLRACIDWQHCKVFELGPASDIAFRNSMNTYPVDTALIMSNINSGSYNLGTIGNIQAIGFQAYDFLLFYGNDADILNTISTSANFRQYLVDLADKMTTDLNYVIDAWNNTYRASYIASTGKASGSSTNDTYNEFVYDLELIKNAKFGFPLGKDILDVPRPHFVEAYFSGESMTLAIENMKANENLFLGRSRLGVDGIGFDDYLDYMDAKRGSEDLEVVIKNQYASLITDMAAIPNPLSDALQTNYSQVNDLYFEIKNQVLYTKTDMSSALGLIIEFFDNDGD